MPLPRGLHDGQRHEGELGDADAVRGDARREVESVARVGRRRAGGGTKPEESRGRESGREESTIYIERLLRFLMTWTHPQLENRFKIHILRYDTLHETTVQETTHVCCCFTLAPVCCSFCMKL
jgi:hypothetical protein